MLHELKSISNPGGFHEKYREFTLYNLVVFWKIIFVSMFVRVSLDLNTILFVFN